jgi:flagellar P-ring protein precursor FlgI
MRYNRLAIIVTVLLLTPSVFAEKIADITRMNGARTNVITGMGLVVGLKGTGDGGAYLPAMRPLANMMKNYEDPASLAELSNAANVAIVSVYATLPATGVRNGDTLDVTVVSIGAATSLKSGVLFMVAMNGPNGKPFKAFDSQGHAMLKPFAVAKGELEPDDNPNPLKGVIRGGAVMEVDLSPKYIDDTGKFQLIIAQPSASWAMSSTIAKMINESSDTDDVAVALDPKNVLVQIPASERSRPDQFIARILALPVPAQAQTQSEARVLIDDKTGTMIVTGDVEISPVVISHKGLTITTITPPPVPTVRNPLVATKASIPLDTTNQGGARLQDLANAFDQLKVPAEDRIVIIKDLYETGKLHAKLIINGQEK